MDKSTSRAIRLYGAEACRKAYAAHLQGEGASTIAHTVDLGRPMTTRQVDAAIAAGRALAESGAAAAPPATAARCEIDTSRYFRSHFRAPRGRGGWIFEDCSGRMQVTFCGTYADAKRQAAAWGRAHGYRTMFVCP